jgi:hypothetical protein
LLTFALVYGDGTSETKTCTGPCSLSFTKTYTMRAQAYEAVLTVSNAYGSAQSTTSIVATSTQQTVAGTPEGTPTPNNNPLECSVDACPREKNGVIHCFSVAACYPISNDICVVQAQSALFTDRDFSQTVCETASATCQQYVWGTHSWSGWSGGCIGDDAGEFLPSWSYPPGARSACPAANQCFTTAGVDGCYGGVENTRALCTDGFDNDCDGNVDAADEQCQARVYGFVFINTASGLSGSSRATVTSGSQSVRTESVLVEEDGSITTFSGAVLRSGEQRVQGTVATSTNANHSTSNSSSSETSPITGNAAAYGAEYYEIIVGAGEDVPFSAGAPGAESASTSLDLDPGSSYELNFTLGERLCNADCSNNQGFCDTSCVGVGGCEPTAEELQTLNACHPPGSVYGLQPGQEVILDYNETTQEALVGLCCAVPPSWRPAPKAVVSENPAFGKIDTLVKYTTLVTINGRPYRLVIHTWE